MFRLPIGLSLALLPLAAAAPGAAQDGNVLYPIPAIERLLEGGQFTLNESTGTRRVGSRTQWIALSFPGDTLINAKFAIAPEGGGGVFNNEPRYEIAAYELQKLFLTEPEYVVPVTIVRAFPVEWARQIDYRAEATFGGTGSTLTVLQYWLLSVTDEDFWDEDRFAADTVYARHMANMNLLTHLINHVDANAGNFLISTTPVPRVFAVDNGVSFRSVASDQGSRWRRIQVPALPHATVDRLRGISEADLTEAMGVLAQFEKRDGMLVRVEPTENLQDNRGVRVTDTMVQLGLTRREIEDVHNRIVSLLERIDRGDIQVF